MKTFTVTLAYDTRMITEVEVEAESIEQAVEIAEESKQNWHEDYGMTGQHVYTHRIVS
tara:strand:+ start:1251 stop:1424 length:174 start_codon:yes stop_codon:yes gene_type:complete